MELREKIAQIIKNDLNFGYNEEMLANNIINLMRNQEVVEITKQEWEETKEKSDKYDKWINMTDKEFIDCMPATKALIEATKKAMDLADLWKEDAEKWRKQQKPKSFVPVHPQILKQMNEKIDQLDRIMQNLKVRKKCSKLGMEGHNHPANPCPDCHGTSYIVRNVTAEEGE